MSYLNIPSTSSAILLGSTTNDSASAGYVGEVAVGTVLRSAANGLADATAENIGTGTNLSLTAGDWIVSAAVGFVATTATVTSVDWGIATTSATFPGTDTLAVPTANEVRGTDTLGITLTSVEKTYAISAFRVTLAATTTLYLIAKAGFSAGAVSVYGSINARRAR